MTFQTKSDFINHEKDEIKNTIIIPQHKNKQPRTPNMGYLQISQAWGLRDISNTNSAALKLKWTSVIVFLYFSAAVIRLWPRWLIKESI